MDVNPTGKTNPPADAMSIGQYASATGLSISAVRFYANRGVLIPVSIDAVSGYRSFSPDQVADGQLIRDLRRLDMALPLIADALAMSPEQRQHLVQAHLEELTASVGRVHAIAHSLGATNRTAPRGADKDITMTIINTTHGSTSLPARSLASALSQVLPVAGLDPAVPHLMTVLLEAKDGSVRLVATDRHRLAVRDVVPSTIEAEFTVVLAAATLIEWRDLLDVAGEVRVEVTDEGALLTGAVEATAVPVPIAYPDYQAVLDTPPGVTTVTADPDSIIAALDSGPAQTMLQFGSPGLIVNGHELATTHLGPDQRVLVNSAYLRDALHATVGREVIIDLVDPLQPVVIRSADDGTFTTLVMPIAPE